VEYRPILLVQRGQSMQLDSVFDLYADTINYFGKEGTLKSVAVIDFRKAATKSDMSRAFSNIERADLKKQLQNFDKLKKNK
jgi:hypothetical protein